MFDDDPEWDLVILTFLHDKIIDASGGIKGYHDEKLVQSALARPLQSAFGKDAYVDEFGKAAALLDSLANNHGFKDGNKRTAMAAAMYYLSRYDYIPVMTNLEYEEFMLYVVNTKPGLTKIKTWLKSHVEHRS